MFCTLYLQTITCNLLCAIRTLQLLHRPQRPKTVTFCPWTAMDSTRITTPMISRGSTSRGPTCWWTRWSSALGTLAVSRRESSKPNREEPNILETDAESYVPCSVRTPCVYWCRCLCFVWIQGSDRCGRQGAEERKREAGEGGDDEGGRDHAPAE